MGLVNIAAFLAQSMKETIKYDACDENNWDIIDGKYPLSNACGQLGQSYQVNMRYFLTSVSSLFIAKTLAFFSRTTPVLRARSTCSALSTQTWSRRPPHTLTGSVRRALCSADPRLCTRRWDIGITAIPVIYHGRTRRNIAPIILARREAGL